MDARAALITLLLAAAPGLAELTPEDLLSPATSQVNLVVTDPELPKLVLPPAEPPPGVRLSPAVLRSNEWRGPQCAVVEQRFAVFRHQDKWAEFWRNGVAPFMSGRWKEPPAVDFSKDMVVGVFLGERRDPHYGVEIRSIQPGQKDGQKGLLVKYREIHTMSGIFNPEFPVEPFHLRRVPQVDGPVLFEAVKR